MNFIKRLRYRKLDDNNKIPDDCEQLKPLFIAKRDEDALWIFHFDEIESTIPLVDYETAHRMLGCSMLQEIAKRSPRPIFLQLVTLMCESFHNVMITNSFECLYRNDDGAVGINFGTHSVFLFPTSFYQTNTMGFDQVTLHKN